MNDIIESSYHVLSVRQNFSSALVCNAAISPAEDSVPARALLVLLSHDICALIICNQGRSVPENTGLPEMLQQAMCPYMMCELRREDEGSGCTETCHIPAGASGSRAPSESARVQMHHANRYICY